MQLQGHFCFVISHANVCVLLDLRVCVCVLKAHGASVSFRIAAVRWAGRAVAFSLEESRMCGATASLKRGAVI
jgi:hypothetical protein